MVTGYSQKTISGRVPVGIKTGEVEEGVVAEQEAFTLHPWEPSVHLSKLILMGEGSQPPSDA